MECLSRGVDDYLLKNSYTAQSLECRLLKLLKYPPPCVWEIKRFGPITLLPYKMEMYVKGTRIRLTNFEVTFLNYLIDKQGICNMQEFQKHLCFTYGNEIKRSNLTVYINRLKKKINNQTSVCRIKSKYGFGYHIDF